MPHFHKAALPPVEVALRAGDDRPHMVAIRAAPCSPLGIGVAAGLAREGNEVLLACV
jgi:hypothetical protein